MQYLDREYVRLKLEQFEFVPQFIVLSAKQGDDYHRFAIVETDRIHRPKVFNPRHKAIKRVVRVWNHVYMGKTQRSSGVQAKTESALLCAQLNEEADAEFYANPFRYETGESA